MKIRIVHCCTKSVSQFSPQFTDLISQCAWIKPRHSTVSPFTNGSSSCVVLPQPLHLRQSNGRLRCFRPSNVRIPAGVVGSNMLTFRSLIILSPKITSITHVRNFGWRNCIHWVSIRRSHPSEYQIRDNAKSKKQWSKASTSNRNKIITTKKY